MNENTDHDHTASENSGADRTAARRDELVSAYFDGEATAEERALVEGDAELMARVEEFRSVAETVAEPVSEVPEMDAVLAKALSEFADSPASQEAANDATSNVGAPRKRRARGQIFRRPIHRPRGTSSGPASLRRQRLSPHPKSRVRRLAPVISLASLLVIVFLAISVLMLISDGSDDADDTAAFLAETDLVSEAVATQEETSIATGDLPQAALLPEVADSSRDGELHETAELQGVATATSTAVAPADMSETQAFDDQAVAPLPPVEFPLAPEVLLEEADMADNDLGDAADAPAAPPDPAAPPAPAAVFEADSGTAAGPPSEGAGRGETEATDTEFPENWNGVVVECPDADDPRFIFISDPSITPDDLTPDELAPADDTADDSEEVPRIAVYRIGEVCYFAPGNAVPEEVWICEDDTCRLRLLE